MKYKQDRDSSAELLRLIIQKMAAHPAAFTPPTYSVWFEILTGINPALTEAVAKLQAAGKKLGDDEIEKLYERHVSECNLDINRLLRQDVGRLISKIAGFTAETDKQAHDFGDSLQSYVDRIRDHTDESVLGSLIGDMLGDTNKMRTSVQQLQSQLEESKREVDKLHHELESAKGEALIDPLTGILNRRGFDLRVQQNLQDGTFAGKDMCLLMVDIDFFKKINDTYGHLVGDKVIRAVAEMLKSKVKGQDSVARLGGEEFAVLLPETDLKGAHVVAEHIRQGIERGKIRRLDSQEPIGGVTVSIGISRMAADGNMSELIDRADQALYVSKQSGRNRTTIHPEKSALAAAG